MFSMLRRSISFSGLVLLFATPSFASPDFGYMSRILNSVAGFGMQLSPSWRNFSRAIGVPSAEPADVLSTLQKPELVFVAEKLEQNLRAVETMIRKKDRGLGDYLKERRPVALCQLLLVKTGLAGSLDDLLSDDLLSNDQLILARRLGDQIFDPKNLLFADYPTDIAVTQVGDATVRRFDMNSVFEEIQNGAPSFLNPNARITYVRYSGGNERHNPKLSYLEIKKVGNRYEVTVRDSDQETVKLMWTLSKEGFKDLLWELGRTNNVVIVSSYSTQEFLNAIGSP